MLYWQIYYINIDMLKKLSNILNYYDSEPMEILLGIVWLIFFPIIWCFQFGFQGVIITSILLGLAMIKSVCVESLRTRKALSYGSFLFSIYITASLFLNDAMINPSNWVWFITFLMSLINLTTVTSQYYRKQK